MYEVAEIQDYRQKWLEAERDLAINWIEFQSDSPNYEPIDNVDKDISTDSFNKDVFIRSLKKASRLIDKGRS